MMVLHGRGKRAISALVLALCTACTPSGTPGDSDRTLSRSVSATTTAAPLDPLALAGLDASVWCSGGDGSRLTPSIDPGAPQPDTEPVTGLSVPGARAFDSTLPPVPVTWSGTEHYLAVLRCGDGWYPASDALVVVAPGPRVAGQVELPATGRKEERAVIERVDPGGVGATVRWRVTSGCCEDLAEYEVDLVHASSAEVKLAGTREVVRSQTLEVSRFNGAAFQHPAGHVACQIIFADEPSGSRAECTLGEGEQPTPRAEDYCDQDYVGIVGVYAAGVSGFACGGDVLVWPVVPSELTNWWQNADFPALPVRGGQGAVLPVGVTLTHGVVSCTSDADGVRCKNAASGAAIWVSASGSRFRLEGNIDPTAAPWAG